MVNGHPGGGIVLTPAEFTGLLKDSYNFCIIHVMLEGEPQEERNTPSTEPDEISVNWEELGLPEFMGTFPNDTITMSKKGYEDLSAEEKDEFREMLRSSGNDFLERRNKFQSQE